MGQFRNVLLLIVLGSCFAGHWPGSGPADVAADEPKSPALKIPRNRMAHTAPVRCVTYSPDGKTLASGSWDYTIKLWDVAMGKE